MSSILYRLGHFSVRQKWLVLAIWVGLFIGIGLWSRAADGQTTDAFELPGTESQEAADLLAAHFPTQSGSVARIVYEAPEGTKLTDAGIVEGITEALREVVYLPGVITPTDDSFVTVSPDDRIAFAEIHYAVPANQVPADDVKGLMATAESAVSPTIKVNFGGDVISAAERQSPPSSELIGLSVAVIVLLIAFGSVVAMGLPLVTALIGVGLATLSISLLSAFIDLSATTPILATMIGLAVGIDYSLFIVTRHRALLHDGNSVVEAAARANATSGGAVVFAGMTVIIALAGLVVSGIPFLTYMGLGAAAAVAIAVLIAITLTPALLGIVGKSIDKWTIPGIRNATGEHADPRKGFTGRFAAMVTDDPIPFLGAGVGLMLLLAIPMSDLQLGLPDDGTRVETSTQRRAYDALARGFGPGFNGPLSIVVDLSNATGATDTLAAIADAVAGDADVANVGTPFANESGDTGIISVIPRSGPSDSATSSLVHRLRDDVIPPAVEGSGAVAFVAGQTAANIDISDKLGGALPLFMGLVLALTMVLLLLAFRSILVPLKAAVAILLSIGSSFGVLVAIFQWGWLASLIGLQSTGPIVSFLPTIMFAILFGLSMDYEVFILSRVKEDYARNGKQAKLAVLTGISASARVITAAALIMVSVFGAFVLGDDKTIKMFGIGLAVAVFLDATVVRMLIVPAVLSLMDRAAWYLPAWLDRILPNLDVEGEKLMERLEKEATARELTTPRVAGQPAQI